MTLTQAETRNRFQIKLDELYEISIALYAEAITNPTDALVQRIEEIAIEREEVHKQWEASWQEPIALAATTPAAIGTDEEPPNRGDTGRGRVQPSAAKKLMLSLVSVKRISSDVPVCNEDPNELEIAGELSFAISGFITPPAVKPDGDRFRVVSGHEQFHATVFARRLNPKAGEHIPARVLEEDNQSTALTQLKMLNKFAA